MKTTQNRQSAIVSPVTTVEINALYVRPENARQSAMGILQDCHFDVFNMRESAISRRLANRHLKGMTVLSHAFKYLAALEGF